MSIIGNLTQFLRSKHAKNFEFASTNPREAQWVKLKSILEKNEQTEFGKKHGFWKINSIEEYQKQVPICTHKDLKPYLDRMANGEKNILTYQEPIYYGMTTGSTGVPKLTPITPDYREEYQTVVQTFLYHVYKDHPHAFDGKALYFTGSATKDTTKSGIPCGTMSGFNFRNLPKLIQKFYALPYEMTDFKDSYSKFYTMTLLSMHKNITFIIAITGAPIISFAYSLIENGEKLIKDLHDGTLNKDLELASTEKELVLARHKANPKLAKKLEKILNEKGQLKPLDVWNNLDLVICWKASNAGGFLKELNQIFEGKVPIRDAIYSATEGWCNIPYNDTFIGGPLAVNAHFYEFFEENDTNNEKVILTDQLESGKKYRIIYTTSGGMYRYDIGDILEIDGKYNNTPCARFVRKTGQSCNIAGELMADNHITEAVISAGNKFDILIPFYCAVPNQEGFPPYYSILIELPENLEEEKVKEISKYIEQEICRVNCDYQALRDDNEMGHISLKLLEKGSINTFKKQQVRNGADEAQIKPLVLALTMDKLSDLVVKKEIKL